MLLGQILATVERHPDPLGLLGEDLDIVTLAQAGAAAERAGLSLGGYLQAAVASFLASASEEEWAQLVSRLQDGRCGPGACLDLMLRRHLRGEAGRGCVC